MSDTLEMEIEARHEAIRQVAHRDERERIARFLSAEAGKHEDVAQEISDEAGGCFGDPTDRDDEIEMSKAVADTLRRLVDRVRAGEHAPDEPSPPPEDKPIKGIDYYPADGLDDDPAF